MEKIKRNREICNLYRQGLSADKMVSVFGVSKQRISLIVKENICKSERLAIREKRRSPKRFEKKLKMIAMLDKKYGITYEQYLIWRRDYKKGERWSIFYDKCVNCGKTEFKHHVQGYCNGCSHQYYKHKDFYVKKKREHSAKWSKNNKIKKKLVTKKYYDRHKEEIIEKQKATKVEREEKKRKALEYYERVMRGN